MADMYDWYSYLIKPTKLLPVDNYYLFHHIFRPVAAAVEIILSTIAYIVNYKGYQALSFALEQEDPALLNKGFKNLYLVLTLTVITFSIAILSMSYRIFFL